MSPLPQTFEANLRQVRDVVRPLALSSRGRAVFLVDADRTLTPDDTSRTFLRLAGLDPLVIKRRFQREGYCFSAFRFHAQVHVELGAEVFEELAPRVGAEVQLHPGALDFLHAARAQGDVYIVSAGIPHIWRHVVRLNKLHDVQVIGGLDPARPFVFGRDEKTEVARIFLGHAQRIIGVGDSEVDAGMLQHAHHAVVVVNHRANVDLLPHVTGHASLWQVAPTHTPHEGIPQLDFPVIAQLAASHPCP